MDGSQGPAFEGDRAGARRFLAGLGADRFYTYVLLDGAGVPFYVGKGKGQRALEHEREALRASPLTPGNPFKAATIRTLRARRGHRLPDLQRPRPRRRDGGAAPGRGADRHLAAAQRRRHDHQPCRRARQPLGCDPFSAERHAATLAGVSGARPERTALNLFLRGLGSVDSVPIKPLAEYRARLVRAYPGPKNLTNPSPRNGLTLAAAALGAGCR